MRSGGAEVDNGIEALGELVEDGRDAAPALDRQLDLDRDTLPVGHDYSVGEVRAGLAFACEHALGDPFACGGA